MKKLTDKQLLEKAKVCYFDKNENLEKIYCNEFGQFAYNNAFLEEPNKHREVKVFMITKENVKKMTLSKESVILDLTKKADREKFAKQQAATDLSKTQSIPKEESGGIIELTDDDKEDDKKGSDKKDGNKGSDEKK